MSSLHNKSALVTGDGQLVTQRPPCSGVARIQPDSFPQNPQGFLAAVEAFLG
jgi:hypothetical protein